MNTLLRKCILTLIAFSCILIVASAQSDTSSEEKGRLIVLRAKDYTVPALHKQIAILHGMKGDLIERKTEMFIVTDESFGEGFANLEHLKGFELRLANRDPEVDFEVLIYGMDGKLKMKKQEIITKTSFNKLVDAMPLRQAELASKLDNE